MQLSELKGHWALVTGASSGIGREFALQLASNGMNVALVARRQHALETLATALRSTHGVKTYVIARDLAAPGASTELRAHLAAERIRVRLLCNNAAFGRWGRFEDSSADTYADMLQLNISAMVTLCHDFMPDLSSFPSSVIINVSSAAAYQPVPFMAVYAATKAFVSSFSQALHGEWKVRGVYVQTLIPGPTDTEFDAVAGAYESSLTTRRPASQVVRDSLEALRNESPVALSAKGTYVQRLFAGLCPPAMVIREVAKRFSPP